MQRLDHAQEREVTAELTAITAIMALELVLARLHLPIAVKDRHLLIDRMPHRYTIVLQLKRVILMLLQR